MHRAALFSLIHAAAIPAFAADQWTRITTPNFELYTTAGEKKGKETVRHFEQVREFFLKASPVRGVGGFSRADRRIRDGRAIPAVPSARRPWRPHTFSLRPRAITLCWAIRPSSDDSLAIHEYMHLIIRHSGLKIPIWLNEGWADVYSTLRPMGKETAVGRSSRKTG